MAWILNFTSTATPRKAVWSQRFKKRPDHQALTRAFREGSGYHGRPILPGDARWDGTTGIIYSRNYRELGRFTVATTDGDWS